MHVGGYECTAVTGINASPDEARALNHSKKRPHQRRARCKSWNLLRKQCGWLEKNGPIKPTTKKRENEKRVSRNSQKQNNYLVLQRKGAAENRPRKWRWTATSIWGLLFFFLLPFCTAFGIHNRKLGEKSLAKTTPKRKKTRKREAIKQLATCHLELQRKGAAKKAFAPLWSSPISNFSLKNAEFFPVFFSQIFANSARILLNFRKI